MKETWIGLLSSQIWYQNGKPHREDGPAVIWAYGAQRWYLYGVPLTEVQYRERVQTRAA